MFLLLRRAQLCVNWGAIMTLLEKLKDQILIADGNGNAAYSYGTGTCFEELNLSNPEDI